MKKVYILVLVLLTCSIQAQIWCTPNSIWYYDTSNPAFNTTYTKHTYLYDTLVGSTTFNKIRSQTLGEGVMGPINQSGFFYTSVQGNVIFFNSTNPSIPNAADTLIYFGPVGSKWRCQPNGNSCQQSYIEIIDAGNVTIQGQNLNWRKINYKNYYYYGTANQYSVTGTDTIFERMGYKHLAFHFLGHCGDMTDFSTADFRCFFDNQLSVHSVTVACDYTTGMEEAATKDNIILVYPNPCNDLLQVEIPEPSVNSNSLAYGVLSIKNYLGEILVISYYNLNTSRLISVNLESLHNGIYFLEIDGRSAKKIVKM